ncbi:MAG: elongation factor EF-2, partial [Candidatus Baldrarchaeia archaeon]
KQADLTLLEPIYRIQITAPQDVIGKVLNLLNQRKGDVERLESDPSSPLIILTGYIPVRTSFGLSTELRSRSSGRAFLQMSFSHWAEVPSESREQIIRELRARRGELYE